MYNFGDIVIVESNLVGVVVKCWGESSNGMEASADVYVRSYNNIQNYPNSSIRSIIYDKELSDEQLQYY